MNTMTAIATISCMAMSGAIGSAVAAEPGAVPVGGPAQASEESQAGLEDIIVTAQRRGENLQKVPISVSAVTGDLAESMGIRTSQDIAVAAPAVTFAETNSGANVTIRGIGGSGSAGDEPGNAIYIDGVYQAGAPGLIFALPAIDRIEVAKGPQGTLFGRNSTGGVVQIITRKPSDTPVFDGAVSYGNYDTREIKGTLSGPLGEGVSASVSGYYIDQKNGWGKNVFDNSDVFLGSSLILHGKLLWKMDDRTTATLSNMYNYTNPPISQGGAIVPGQTTLSFGGVSGAGNAGFYNVNQNFQNSRKLKYNQTSFKLEHEFDWARLVEIAAYSRTENKIFIDTDFGPANRINLYLDNPIRTFTNELQLLSPESSKVTWSLGFFYLSNKIGLQPSLSTGGALASSGGSRTINAASRTHSYSVYGQATVPLFPDTNATVGLRYTRDRMSFDIFQVDGLGATASDGGAKTESKLTWRMALDHRFSSNLLGYASYNRGYHSGLFNIAALNQPSVDPETVDAYEIGLKSELFDRRIRINISAFRNDFSGIQLRAISQTGSSFLINAANARIKGVDLDLAFAFTRNLTFQASASYLDTSYTSFPGAPFFSVKPAGGLTQTVGDASGNDLVFAPRFVASIGGSYRIPTSIGEFSLSGSVYYNDGFYFDPQNFFRQDSYTLVNAAVKWTEPSERFYVELWSRNLTDRQYYTYGTVSTSGSQYFPAAPRTMGIRLGVKFQ